jgi:hypothetical protein
MNIIEKLNKENRPMPEVSQEYYNKFVEQNEYFHLYNDRLHAFFSA